MELKKIAELVDDQYPFIGVDHDRQIARAILMNDRNEVLLMHVKCDDMFGHRDYYETPGGGVEKGESLEHAVVREIAEETGYKADIVCPLGYVSDYYNLLKRHNINNYFLLKVVSKGETHLDQYENGLFGGAVWFPAEKAVQVYESMTRDKLERLVMRRELPVLREAIKVMESL